MITNPAAVPESKVRAITSILLTGEREREREEKELFLIKTHGRGELVIISRRSQCHVVWTACGFHLKTVAALKEMHLPRPSQPQPPLQR